MSPDERVRLFVALELPDEVVSALVSWRSGVAAGPEVGGPDLRLLPAEALHVTLCFLGSRGESEVEEIASACRRAVAGRGRASLSLGEATWLPRRRPRVLAVGVEDASGRLQSVQGALSSALQAGGWYVAEKRPFLAHITVARVRGREAVAVPRASLTEPPRMVFQGSTVTLFRSHLSPVGAQYERLERVEL